MTEPYPIPDEHAIMTVTPAMAADWLENRNLSRNRRYSPGIETKYAAEIRAGLWKTSPQGVSFDRDGFLLDGQHRLGAIAKTRTTVDLFVTVGWDPGVFDVIDTGHKRAASQLIEHPHAKVMSSSARFLGAIDGTVSTGRIRGGVFAVTASTAEVLHVIEAWPELGTFAASAVHCRNKGQILAAAHLAVLAQASRTQYADRIPMWLDGLAHGENLTGTDARLHLRNRFATERRALINQQPMTYALIVRAWNAYAAGTPMGVLRVRGEDHMPQVIQ